MVDKKEPQGAFPTILSKEPSHTRPMLRTLHRDRMALHRSTELHPLFLRKLNNHFRKIVDIN